jgi:hypothetical protein
MRPKAKLNKRGKRAMLNLGLSFRSLQNGAVNGNRSVRFAQCWHDVAHYTFVDLCK